MSKELWSENITRSNNLEELEDVNISLRSGAEWIKMAQDTVH
jgi:hypothetical protein